MILTCVTSTLALLRQLIREELLSDEVQRNMRWSAGFCGGGAGGSSTNSSKGLDAPPPGLGDEEDQDEEQDDKYGKSQEKNQFAARVDKRRAG